MRHLRRCRQSLPEFGWLINLTSDAAFVSLGEDALIRADKSLYIRIIRLQRFRERPGLESSLSNLEWRPGA